MPALHGGLVSKAGVYRRDFSFFLLFLDAVLVTGSQDALGPGILTCSDGRVREDFRNQVDTRASVSH
jgi:hypothetical protein